MEKYPRINVLVLNWNGKKILDDCLKSILQSTYKNYIITVIDNGSLDDSIEGIDKISDKIKIIKINENIGYSRGYNHAFKKLKKDNDDFYFLLNNDTTIDKNTIMSLYNSVKKFGLNTIFSPKIINSNNNSVWYAGGKLSPVTGLSYHVGINSHENNVEYKNSVTDFVSGCAMLIDKSKVNSLGGFNESFNFYYEDIDLCLRAKNNNIKCVFVNNSIVYHKISSSMGGRFSPLKNYYKLISSIKFLYFNNNFLIFIIYLLINIILFPFRLFFKILSLLIS